MAFPMAAAITAGASLLSPFIGKALNGDKAQYKQQEKLTNLQAAKQKELITHSNAEQEAMQMRMWENTNLPAQIKMAKEAGMSISALYGGSGGGGTTVGAGGASGSVSGGQADGPAARAGMSLQIANQIAMQAAQVENLRANTEKTKAEAENIAGVERESKGETLKTQQFQNEVNKIIGTQRIADSYLWASEKIGVESQRATAEWEAYQAAGYKGKSFSDPESPVAKALKAGFEKSVEELKAAKTENNIKKAELTIKQFEAGLAKEGISPSSPWYIKIVGDLMQKTGLGGILDTAKKIDQEVKSHDKGTQDKKLW